MSFGKEYNLTVSEYSARNITQVLDTAGTTTRQISSEFQRFLSNGNNLTAMFAGLKSMFKNFAKNFLGNLKAKIAGKIGEMAGKLLEGPMKAVKGVLGQVTDAANLAKGQIADAVGNLVGESSSLKQVFSFLPDSVQNGIMNAAGSFGSVFDVVGAGSKAIGGVLDNIASGKYILNPGSFKQDIKNIGAFVTAGFENGINNALSNVVNGIVVNGIANPEVIMGVAGKVLDSVVESKDFGRFMDVAKTIGDGAIKFVTNDIPNIANDIAGSVMKPVFETGNDLAKFGTDFTSSMDTVFPSWDKSTVDGGLSTGTLSGASEDVKDGLYASTMNNIPDATSASSLDQIPTDRTTLMSSSVNSDRPPSTGGTPKYEYGYADDGTVNKIYVVQNGQRTLDWSEGDAAVTPATSTSSAVEKSYTPSSATVSVTDRVQSTYTPGATVGAGSGVGYGQVDEKPSNFQRGQPATRQDLAPQEMFPELFKK